jgi:hypothetical protein
MSFWADYFKNTFYCQWLWVNECWTNSHLMCVSFLLIVFCSLATSGSYSLNSAKEKVMVNLNSNIFSVRSHFVDISWYCLCYLSLWFWSPHRWCAFNLNSTHYCIWQLIWTLPPTVLHNRKHGACCYFSLPWVRAYLFYSNVPQSVLGFFSPYFKKV